MSDKYFPANTCVLACSGPSLNTVDPFSLGLPVVVVSTAIRKITKPHFWVIADYLNEMHGVEGSLAYSDPNIVKILPEGKVSSGANAQSVVLCNYDTSTRWPDVESVLFNGAQPFIRGPHKSVTFAIQWLHYIGVKNVIWVGNDLKANSMREKYCYEVQEFDMKKAYNYDKTLDQTAGALRQWYPIALKRGFKWFSWNCGEVFESFVPKFDLNWWESEGKEQLKQYAPITFPTVDIPAQTPSKPKIEKIEYKNEVQVVRKQYNPEQPQQEKKESPKPFDKDAYLKSPYTPNMTGNHFRREMRRNEMNVKKQLRARK